MEPDTPQSQLSIAPSVYGFLFAGLFATVNFIARVLGVFFADVTGGGFSFLIGMFSAFEYIVYFASGAVVGGLIAWGLAYWNAARRKNAVPVLVVLFLIMTIALQVWIW